MSIDTIKTHMNEHHVEELKSLVNIYGGFKPHAPKLIDVDKNGLTIQADGKEVFVPFPNITEEKDYKNAIIALCANIEKRDDAVSVEIESFRDGFNSIILASLSSDKKPCISYSPLLKYQGNYYLYISEVAQHFGNLKTNPDCMQVMFIEDETKPIYIEAEVTCVEPEEKELTNEEKIAYILEEYNLTMDQFNVIAAIILAEAQANNYDGAYDIVNALYNRTWSKRWVGYIEGLMNCDTGRNLYTQATALSQFEVYTNGGYLQFLNNSSDLVGYQAVIDMLYSQESHHNFMSFYADPNEPNGTHFHDVLTDEDRIVLENSR